MTCDCAWSWSLIQPTLCSVPDSPLPCLRREPGTEAKPTPNCFSVCWKWCVHGVWEWDWWLSIVLFCFSFHRYWNKMSLNQREYECCIYLASVTCKLQCCHDIFMSKVQVHQIPEGEAVWFPDPCWWITWPKCRSTAAFQLSALMRKGMPHRPTRFQIY